MQSYFDSKTYKQSKMTNPASASQRFKNHLAYQLGLCMLYFYQDGKSAPQDSSNAHTQALVAKNMGGGAETKESYCHTSTLLVIEVWLHTLSNHTTT